jgi:hypothetical protein
MPQNNERPARKPEGMGGLAKGLAIVEAFSAHPVMSVADAARVSGATRASARRCLMTLTELGYVEHSGREFRPLTRLRRLGGVASRRDQLAQLAQPFLARARDKLAESVSLAVLDDDGSLFIARAEAEHIVSTGVRVGARPSRLLFGYRARAAQPISGQGDSRAHWPKTIDATNIAHSDETIRRAGRDSIGSRTRLRRQRRGARARPSRACRPGVGRTRRDPRRDQRKRGICPGSERGLATALHSGLAVICNNAG